ncbi:PLD nuclease N-terminal domain-containing protein [Thalassobacterium sedimentorum]|uniref:PLD nuclease N-terminal domain-containing protein n=1 Tax=Thalassobacterium sedimentorum TaxID=3041258 RepID=UPI0031F2EF35
MLFGIGAFAFWIWMLVDCLKYESSDGNDKLVWVLVIVFTNWIGALIYFLVRRGERRRLADSRPRRR